MAIITTGTPFNPTQAVTSTDLNNIANAATFNDPVDETSLELITAGTNIGKLQIKDAGVTKAKIENVANLRVLGNTSGSAVAPQEVEILDDDTMATATNATLATSESIKAYVDASALTPSYVGISSNSSLTITQTDTSTTTHTYPIANFVGTGFNAAKVTGFYVEITASCRRLSTKTIADVKATFPDGTDHVLLGHSCDTPEDQTSESRGTVFCPVTQGQTNLVIKPTLSGNTRTTTFTIVGCTQFV